MIRSLFIGTACSIGLTCADPGSNQGDLAGHTSVEVLHNERVCPAGEHPVSTSATTLKDIFHHVRGAVQLSSGGTAVLNGDPPELRLYDRSGRLLQVTGREGGGPGEFRVPMGIWRYGSDSLAVWDRGLQKVLIFSQAGELGREVFLANTGARLEMIGILSKGDILVRTDNPQPTSDKVTRNEVLLIRHLPRGTTRDTIARYRGPETKLIQWTDGNVLWSPTVFGGQSVFVASGDAVYASDADVGAIDQYDTAGKRSRVITWNLTTTRVTQDEIESYRTDHLSSTVDPNERRARERYLAAVAYAPTFPAVRTLLVAADGDLWVLEYPRPSGGFVHRWIVFDSAGVTTGCLLLGRHQRLLHVQDQSIALVEYDGTGVESVLLRRLASE